MRVLFFGMLGTLTRLPLAALIDSQLDLCGLVLPAEIVPPFELTDNGRSRAPIISIRKNPVGLNVLPTGRMPSPLALAAEHGLPSFAVRELAAPESVAALAALQPDLICVSCFPHRLPPAILHLPTFGCLNVHPSLLPRFRGPSPIFWALRAGAAVTGVTIHFMDEGFDTGEIALQRPFTLPDGLTHAELEMNLAQIGGELLVEAHDRLAAGTLPRRPQPPGFDSDPRPRDADFELNGRWSARHAFNFMRGTAQWERPYFIRVQGKRVWLKAALAYEPDSQQGQPLVDQTDHVRLQMSPGILWATRRV